MAAADDNDIESLWKRFGHPRDVPPPREKVNHLPSQALLRAELAFLVSNLLACSAFLTTFLKSPSNAGLSFSIRTLRIARAQSHLALSGHTKPLATHWSAWHRESVNDL
ncbi:hypothetical protein FV229_22755 [Methylobacterium sp. WL120]|nr:hypothetical protein FV229_22755 [Methylobacterium sp. WL120]